MIVSLQIEKTKKKAEKQKNNNYQNMGTVALNHKSDLEIEQEFIEIQAAQKNPARFEVLYNRYHEQIFRFIYQRMDSEEIAFDITSQVFMKALSNIKNYKNKGVPFSAWLYRIASNEMNSFFKKNKQTRTVNAESSHIESIAEEMEEETLDDMYQTLMGVITDLPEKDLMLIEMRYFEHRPFKEIADILSITETNAKVKVYRIIDKLKKMVKNK